VRIGRDVRFSTVPEWLVYADVSAYAVRVWAVLDRKADSETGQCEISVAEVARRGRCSVNTAKKAIAELEQAGALEVERGRVTASGDPDSNAYTLITSDPSRRDGGRSRDDLPGGSRDDGQVRRAMTEGVGHDVATRERKPSTSKATKETSLSVVGPAFDEFWSAYPRKIGKGSARTAWEKRIKAGADARDLVIAATGFSRWVVAALQCGEVESMKYIPHPSTWLNQERDQDTLTTPGRAPAAQSKVERARAEHAKRYGHAS
jgi:hypothetical protein